jgi:hypothetical protein
MLPGGEQDPSRTVEHELQVLACTLGGKSNIRWERTSPSREVLLHLLSHMRNAVAKIERILGMAHDGEI